MAIIVDFSLRQSEDGTLTISMVPPVPIGGWNIQFQVLNNFFGTSGLITKSISSGLNGQSGITVISSGKGVFNIQINSLDSSGLDCGSYATLTKRLDSGFQTVLTQGYLVLNP